MSPLIFSFYVIVSIEFCSAQSGWPKEIIIPSAPNYIGLSAPSSLELKWSHAQSYCQFYYGTSLATILTTSDQAEIEALAVQLNVDNGGGQDGDQATIGYANSDSSTKNIAWAPCALTIHEECTYDPCEANNDYWATWHPQEGSFEKNRCGFVKRGNNGGTLGKWVFDTCGELRDFICNAPDGIYSKDINCFPTPSPTSNPTLSPTNIPTTRPTQSPLAPGSPTKAPSNPTVHPTTSPSIYPTQLPSMTPTKRPSANPSQSPTYIPSVLPTKKPTIIPTEEAEVNQIRSTNSENVDLSDMDNDEYKDKDKSTLMLIVYILSGGVIVLILIVLMLFLLFRREKNKVMNLQTMRLFDHETQGARDNKQTVGVVDTDGGTKIKEETNVFQQIQMEAVGNGNGETQISSSDSESLFDTNDKIKETKGVNDHDINTQGDDNDSNEDEHDNEHEDMYIKKQSSTKKNDNATSGR